MLSVNERAVLLALKKLTTARANYHKALDAAGLSGCTDRSAKFYAMYTHIVDTEDVDVISQDGDKALEEYDRGK